MFRARLQQLMMLTVWLCSAASPVLAQEGVRVIAWGEKVISIEAGGVGTRLVQLVNEGAATVSTRLVVKMPAGWTVLIPPPVVSIDAGRTVSQLVSFQVPVSTAAGSYEIELATEGHSDLGTTLPVIIEPSFSIRQEWIETQQFVRAGGRISAILSVLNTGNAPATVDISGRSSLGYGVSVSPENVRLSVGETKQVEVQVTTGEDISSRLAHSIIVELKIRDSEEQTLRTLSFNSDILPTKKALGSNREGVLPLRIGFSGSTEEGRRSGQVEIDLPETKVGNRLYEALVRIPDVRDASVFAFSDQYSFKMTSPRTRIRIGDHQFQSTDLLESGTLGFGAGIEIDRVKVSTGVFAQRSRKVFPEREQAGAFVHYRPMPGIQLEANTLVKRSYEEGTAISVAAELSPGLSLLRAEYATGWFGADGTGGKQRGEAVEISASTSVKNSTFSADYDWANNAFLGSLQNTRSASGAFTITLREWFRLHGQASLLSRFYEITGAPQAEQTAGNAKAGFTLTSTGVNRAFISVSTIKQINENTLSALKRDDIAFEIRTGYNQRKLGLSTTFIRGQAEDGLRPNLNPYYSGAATVSSSVGQFSFNVFGSYLQGPTFYNPVDQERIMVGSSLGWDSGKGTQVHGSVFKSIDLAFEQQEFLLSDIRILHRFSFGHDLILRARVAQTSSDASIRNGTFGVTYRMPLYVPAPGMRGKRDIIEGQVVDAVTGKPIQDVILSLDAKTFVTDSEGRFSVLAPESESVYLSIDRLSIGLDRRPLQDFPIQISSEQRQPLLINVVRSAKIIAQVTFDGDISAGRTAALAQDIGKDAVAGIVVEARLGKTRVRRLTSASGEAQFTDLVPGEWKIFAIGSTIPNGYTTSPDSALVTATPGSTNETTFEIKPVSRGIQMVSSGSASLGKGIRVGGAVPVKVVRDTADPKTDSAGAPNVVRPPREPVSPPESNQGTPNGELPRTHIVKQGETLAQLARQYYQSTLHWVRLWQANTRLIPNPDIIRAGTELVIPEIGKLTGKEKAALREYAKGLQ
ncbi:LysM peptidoglycan-binding domain-containing protein [bacterium]|nr:LysM peptidoglycan-binding domain-containing protein [bacterium]